MLQYSVNIVTSDHKIDSLMATQIGGNLDIIVTYLTHNLHIQYL